MKKQVIGILGITLVTLPLLSVFNPLFVWNPFRRIWEAICELQAEVDSLNTSLVKLQDKMEARIPQKGYISISPPAFNSHNEYQRHNRGGFYLEGSGPYTANVQLPHGATIKNFTVYLYDNSASYGMQVRLLIHDLHNFSWDILASVDTYPASETLGRVALYSDISNGEVDNQHYSYYVTVHFDIDGFTSELSLQGVVIEYQYPL